jgi:hypothetical protein
LFRSSDRIQVFGINRNFKKEASGWPAVQIDPANSLVFVAYFVTEAELNKNIEQSLL